MSDDLEVLKEAPDLLTPRAAKPINTLFTYIKALKTKFEPARAMSVSLITLTVS
jgi:hypothetical protein